MSITILKWWRIVELLWEWTGRTHAFKTFVEDEGAEAVEVDAAEAEEFADEPRVMFELGWEITVGCHISKCFRKRCPYPDPPSFAFEQSMMKPHDPSSKGTVEKPVKSRSLTWSSLSMLRRRFAASGAALSLEALSSSLPTYTLHRKYPLSLSRKCSYDVSFCFPITDNKLPDLEVH